MDVNSPESQTSASLAVRRRNFYLLAIFLLAVAFRTYAAMWMPAVPVADASDYHRLAIGLVERRGYVNTDQQPTAWRPPGYPAFLAGIYRVFGTNIQTATIVQAVLGGMTVLLLVVFGSMIIGWRASIITGFLAAAYPGFIWLSRLLLSENLALFLLLATLCSAAMYLKSRRIWWMAIFGAVGGLSTLVRGGNLFVTAFIGVGILVVTLRRRPVNWRQLVALSALAIAGFSVALMPWTIRNYRVFHRFVPVATQDGLTLYASYWPPQKDGKLIWGTLPDTSDPAVAAAAQTGDEVSASKYLSAVTKQRLRENPGYFFRLIPSKLISLVVPLDWEIFPHAAGSTRSLNVGYLLIILPALLGFVVLLRKPVPQRWLLWVLPATVLFQAIFFYGSPRFRLPAELIAILLAAVGCERVWAFLKKRGRLLG
jgi:4-amino-4-deoxy-L-arabinose transferase-like glycosyltransferase